MRSESALDAPAHDESFFAEKTDLASKKKVRLEMTSSRRFLLKSPLMYILFNHGSFNRIINTDVYRVGIRGWSYPDREDRTV